MRGPVRIRVAVILGLVAALTCSAASMADRKATSKERRQIARVIDVPVECAQVRISTVTEKPKWGSVAWKPGSEVCIQFASDGVTIARKRKSGPPHWKAVTAGSDFECADLYARVPEAVAKDLGISCH